MVKASLEEVRSTVERMEGTLREMNLEIVRKLLKGYDQLVPRFERDLDNERDQLLSRGAVLMLIQEISKQDWDV